MARKINNKTNEKIVNISIDDIKKYQSNAASFIGGMIERFVALMNLAVVTNYYLFYTPEEFERCVSSLEEKINTYKNNVSEYEKALTQLKAEGVEITPEMKELPPAPKIVDLRKSLIKGEKVFYPQITTKRFDGIDKNLEFIKRNAFIVCGSEVIIDKTLQPSYENALKDLNGYMPKIKLRYELDEDSYSSSPYAIDFFCPVSNLKIFSYIFDRKIHAFNISHLGKLLSNNAVFML